MIPATRRPWSSRAMLAIILAAAAACANERPSAEAAAATTTVGRLGAPESVPASAEGRWRLASARTLRHSLLWVSHILIRHQAVTSQVPCTRAPWQLPPPPRRSREEASKLASEIEAQVRQDESRFAEIAQQYSDDVTTRSFGGALGGVRAFDCEPWEPILDALAQMRPGQVSTVIETTSGFHILQRRGLPPLEDVSGRHIVVGYDGADWLRLVGSPAPARSRAEAEAIAERLYLEASRDPERFGELLREHSDHPDETSGGDLGTWSTREPSHLARAIEVMNSLPIGGVARPLDSKFGFQIIQRTENRARKAYAMEAIKLAYEPGNLEQGQAASARARELLSVLAADPSRFDELRAQHCCPGVERWFDGRVEASLTRAVAPLALQEIARAPVHQYLYITIPRRVAAAASDLSAEVHFEVPSPEHLELDAATERLPYPTILTQLDAVAVDGRVRLELKPDEESAIQEYQRRFAQMAEANQVAPALLQLFAKLETLLGARRFASYRSMLDDRLEAAILRQVPLLLRAKPEARR
jgi:hypothetical protein